MPNGGHKKPSKLNHSAILVLFLLTLFYFTAGGVKCRKPSNTEQHGSFSFISFDFVLLYCLRC